MHSIIYPEQILLLCSKAMRLYDDRLVNHGTRVAYIANLLKDELEYKDEIDHKKLFLMAIFHDIGAFKTDEIDKMLEFESFNVIGHAIYGHLFFKYLTPLQNSAFAVLHHHTHYAILNSIDHEMVNYAKILQIADRIDVGIMTKISKERFISNIKKSKMYDPDFIEPTIRLLEKHDLFAKDAFADCEEWSNEEILSFDITKEEAHQYLEMLIYSIDFKSPSTVLHSVTTASVAKYIGEQFKLSEVELDQIYYAGMVHDIGKIAIPKRILEFPGKLSPEDMEIMRGHILYSENILQGIFGREVINIAVRHHEKLNGMGYPYGLSAKDLNLSERIMAVADITSALLGSRSYKESFNWDKTVIILEDMSRQGFIDEKIVSVIINNKEQVEQTTMLETTPILQKYATIQKEYEILMESMS